MTTVDGLTKARMLEIEGSSIVDGEIIGDHLILNQHNGDTVDAGDVRGPKGNMDEVVATVAELNSMSGSFVNQDQMARLVGLTSAVQAQLDSQQLLVSDLTAIAALNPSNDDFIQRKAGVWTKRTIAQLKTDFNITPYLTSRRRYSIGQVFTTGVFETIPYNTLELNEIPWDAVNSRFTVPTAGYYLIHATIHWISNAVGYRDMAIIKSGVLASSSRQPAVTGASGGTSSYVTSILKCAAGDTIMIQGRQGSGADLACTTSTAFNFVDITRIGQ